MTIVSNRYADAHSHADITAATGQQQRGEQQHEEQEFSD
jgi:hypothetical protein